MDRQTIRYPDGAVELKCSVNDAVMRLAAYEDTDLEPEEFHKSVDFVLELNKKLKPYMDAESEGRLIVLPCKVGDTVYVITERTNSFGEVRQFVQKKKVIKVNLENDGLWIVVDDYDSWEAYPVGSKRLFFTREEAEAALGGDGS